MQTVLLKFSLISFPPKKKGLRALEVHGGPSTPLSFLHCYSEQLHNQSNGRVLVLAWAPATMTKNLPVVPFQIRNRTKIIKVTSSLILACARHSSFLLTPAKVLASLCRCAACLVQQVFQNLFVGLSLQVEFTVLRKTDFLSWTWSEQI